MRLSRAVVTCGLSVVIAVGLLAAIPSAASAGGTSPRVTAAAVEAAAVTTGVTAFFEMNEPAGTSVMHDSSPNGLDTPVDPTGVQSGAVYNGATGYNWVRRPPEAFPTSPERVIQVADDIAVEPGNQPFTIEIRYRTKEKFGNITQKGQAQSRGGQWKIQNPQGIPSCLFSGSQGQVATGAKTPLNDNEWHTLRCDLTSSGVSMYVDGVFRNRKNGSTGTIDNSIPMTIGGKINCDQIEITCDYFSGQIDYIKITKGGGVVNTPPVANFTSTCTLLQCGFTSTSSDDGTITSRAWTFGDGGTSTLENPTHTYSAAGTYDITLTVTDNAGLTDSETKSVTVSDQPVDGTVDFVASNASASTSATPAVTMPAGVEVGDRLVLALSINNLSRTFTNPSGGGWTRLGTTSSVETMSTTVWTKVADGSGSVSVQLSGTAKSTLSLAAYSGVASSLQSAQATNSASLATRATPTVAVPAGAWVISYWADKSATTTAWSPVDPTAHFRSICGTSTGHICAGMGDSGGPVSAGSYGSIRASTGAATSMATMWAVVLPPAATP